MEYSLKRYRILLNMFYPDICNMALINFDMLIVGIYAALESWKNVYVANDCTCGESLSTVSLV
jgi:hypothetical protein